MDEKRNEVSNKKIDCSKMIQEYEKCIKDNENENKKCNNFVDFITLNCKDDEFKKFIDM